MAYDNRNRPGVRTTQTVNPQTIVPDIDERIRTLAPESTPLIWLGEKLGKGGAPKSKKVQVMQYYEFDHVDTVTAVTMGTASEVRFMRLTMAQISRPTTNGTMYYYPQDKFWIPETGQTVEVVITPDAAMVVNGSEITLTGGLTGNTTTRTAGSDIVVRVVDQVPAITWTGGDIFFMGRSISESQDIEAQSAQRDVMFDCNYVEHKEAVYICTEDQTKFIQQYGKLNDLTWQQEQMIKEFKKSVEYSAFFGERAVNYDQNNRPTFHMRGLIPTIRTNVTVYNPDYTDDFEQMVSSFMLEQAFRYNTDGVNSKIAFCGARFLHNFNLAFREYRRSDISKNMQTPGLDIHSYHWMGNTLHLVRNDVFRQGTALENWCAVVEPSEAEWRVAKNFESRTFDVAYERLHKLMVEWQGTIAWHCEEKHALLRTP